MNNHDNSIDYMKIRTRNNSDPHGKPKVYFTCHPQDFDKYFDRICNDIFKTQDCVIYYTEDMNKPLPEVYRDTDLGSMNLFVVPITWRLLYEPNRAMDSDLAFAFEHNYPILPLMMESGIDEFYTQKFGKRQYLNPFSHDITEISYEEKLKKYLASVLLDDKTIKRIQAAFDAYIFLSYRKKDRHLANELMKLIHDNPKYRDIAIWYDEYLVPGEDFETIIRQALDKSELFTLLVTPNLINEDNYIRNVEYPEARKANKHILPAEMVKTDKDTLKEQYEGIPLQIDAHNQDELDESLLKALKEKALEANDNDPEHNYLIGLAYLEGIDVEVNINRGIELITSSAEASYPEAMETLYELYNNGDKVDVNYQESLKWAKKLTDYCIKKYGEEDEKTLSWTIKQGRIYIDIGGEDNYEIAYNLFDKCRYLCVEVLGELHRITLSCDRGTTDALFHLFPNEETIGLKKVSYDIFCKVFGEKDSEALDFLWDLVHSYTYLGFMENSYSQQQIKHYKKALELAIKLYQLYFDVFGEEDIRTIMCLEKVASRYKLLDEYQYVIGCYEKIYKLYCNVFGEKDLKTTYPLTELAKIYKEFGSFKEALELYTRCYILQCEVLGEKHIDSIKTLNDIACLYFDLKKYKKSMELKNKCYALYCEVYGLLNYRTLRYLTDLADDYKKIKNNKKALELYIECCRQYDLHFELYGDYNDFSLEWHHILSEVKSICNHKFSYYFYRKKIYSKSLEYLLMYYDIMCFLSIKYIKDIYKIRWIIIKLMLNYEKLNDFENVEKYRKILKEYEN